MCLWAAGLGAGLWERNRSKLEIPGRSSPLTYLLLSPPNLLTFGKGESLQFACFSKFPLSPVLLPARHGSAGLPVALAQRRALAGGEEEGEGSPSPPWCDGPVPVAQSDAQWPQVMPYGGTGAPRQTPAGAVLGCRERRHRAPQPFSWGST